MGDVVVSALMQIGIGTLLVCSYPLAGKRYLEQYQDKFFANAGRRMGLDVLWMILSRGRVAPIALILVIPLVGIGMVAIGVVNLVMLASCVGSC